MIPAKPLRSLKRAFLLALLGLTQALAASPPVVAFVDALDVATPSLPALTRVDGNTVIQYELHVTNFGNALVAVEELDVRAAAGTALSHFARPQLLARASVIGRSGDPLTLEPGERAVLYLEAVCDSAPEALINEIAFRSPRDQIAGKVSHRTAVRTNSRDAVLGPPLAGGPWVAIYSAQWTRGHRRVFYAVDGRAILPGRFAIDWVRLDAQHQVARGDPDVVANHVGYGTPVLAVADARVVAMRSNVVEQPLVSQNPHHALEEAAGNYVALELADGRFVIYEHLRPGSSPVKVGDAVHRGAVIGELGFTGDSTGPHLHFHVADRAEPLKGDGLPFALEHFDVVGGFDDAADIGSQRWRDLPAGAPHERRDEFPAPLAVVMFQRDE
ncbi:MAG TPA: M23 family metallopeptidase [Povalibacter sp.]